MKVLIYSVILIAAQAGAQDVADKNIDCARVRCAPPVPPVCPSGTVLTKLSTPRPGKCCNPYECIQGITLPGQCCPQPGQCECKPAVCVKKECRPGYVSVLVSPGSGKPGDCCGIYKCKPVIDCATVRCARPEPPVCPRGTILIKHDIPRPGDCCNPYECITETDCSLVMCPAVMPPPCPPGTMRVKRETPIPGDCCNIYECRPDMTD